MKEKFYLTYPPALIKEPIIYLLVKKFEGRVQTTPRIVPSTREATFDFQSSLARVRLKFSVDAVRCDVESNVGFGPRKWEPLLGKAR